MEEAGKYNVIHEKERKLIEYIRELGFGQDGLPVMIVVAKEKVKL